MLDTKWQQYRRHPFPQKIYIDGIHFPRKKFRRINSEVKSPHFFFTFQVMSSSLSLDNISSLSMIRTSESFSDLNAELNNGQQQQPQQQQPQQQPQQPQSSSMRRGLSHSTSLRLFPSSASATAASLGLTSSSPMRDDDAGNKPFGLGRKILILKFLILRH